MNNGLISLESLKNFAESLNEKILQTRKQGRKFMFLVDELGFRYIPESSNKERIQEDRYINRMLERYNQTKSLKTSDYVDITKNASYLLVIIIKYLEFSDIKDNVKS